MSIKNLLSAFLVQFLLIPNLSYAADDKPTCLDDNGNPVDWYIAYKLPHLSNEQWPFNTGYSYAYITSESVKEKDPYFWKDEPHDDLDPESEDFLESFKGLLLNYLGHHKIYTRRSRLDLKSKMSPKKVPPKGAEGELQFTISDKLITDPKSMILRTIALAYDNRGGSKLSSILYNDGAPDVNNEESNSARQNVLRAHAKGTVIINAASGDSLWLTHSCPQFPPPRNKELKFNENCKRSGQSFMCFNFDFNKTGKQIIDHLVNMHPLVYDSYISDRIYELVPEINDLKLEIDSVGKRRKRNEDSKLAQEITTKGGFDLLLYSKSSDFGEDMYSDWLSDELKSALYVETWRNGAGTSLNSSCPRNSFYVKNIQDLRLTLKTEKLTWSYRQDHSKWAISENKDQANVCITDINRMQSQFKRGGGAVCFKCPSCWSIFNQLVADVEPCPVEVSKSIMKASSSNKRRKKDKKIGPITRIMN